MHRSLLAVAVTIAAITPCAEAAACTDAGAPITCAYPTRPDAGADCNVVQDSCGCWQVLGCPVDAGPRDAGPPPVCSAFRDTGVDGPSGVRTSCTSSAECTPLHPSLVCAPDGFCACAGAGDAGASATGAGGCSVGVRTSERTTLTALALAIAALVLRRARAGVTSRSVGRAPG